MTVAISFRIEKATPEGRYVSGWLSVIEKDGKRVEDTQGDLISMDELRKGVHRYMGGERTIKKQHSGGEIGKMVEVVMIDDDFAKAHGIAHGKRGAWGTAEITDEATRDDVRKGKVTGWSMGGRGKRTPIQKHRSAAMVQETDVEKAKARGYHWPQRFTDNKGLVTGGSKKTLSRVRRERRILPAFAVGDTITRGLAYGVGGTLLAGPKIGGIGVGVGAGKALAHSATALYRLNRAASRLKNRKAGGNSPAGRRMGFYKSSSTPLAALSEAIAKAGMIRGGSAQAHYRARRGYDRAGGRRIKANLSPGPAGKFSRVARASRASRYLLRRLNRNQSHSWGFGRRPDGSTAT